MKYLRRYLSLLFALVMSLSLFSVTALAETVYKSNIRLAYVDLDIDQTLVATGTDVTLPLDYTIASNAVTLNNDYMVTELRMEFVTDNGELLLKKGDDYQLNINNIKPYYQKDGYTYKYYWDDSLESHLVYLIYSYTDGTSEYLYLTGDEISFSSGTQDHFISYAGIANGDVRKIILVEEHNSIYIPGSNVSVKVGLDPGLNVTIGISTEEAVLLKGILGKLTEGFQDLKDGISNVVQTITELPQKLWEKIETGLKSLFIPSEEDIVAYKDKWDQLLEDRLGAVYQVVNILTESWDQVMNADETNTVEFPSATINLGGVPFTFGGYQVQIVPNGFDVIVNAVKLIVGIVCTIACVNGLRKRYDEIMGVEQ